MPLSELDNSTKKIWMQHFQILAPIVTKHRGLSHQQIWKVLTSPSRNNLIPLPAHCQRPSGTLSCNGQQPGSQLARKERTGGDLAVHSTPPSEREASISAGRIFRRLANRLYAPMAFSKLHKVPVGVLLILGGVLEGNELNFWENSFRSVLLLFSNFAPFLTSVVPPIWPKIWHSLPFHRLRKRFLLVSCDFFRCFGHWLFARRRLTWFSAFRMFFFDYLPSQVNSNGNFDFDAFPLPVVKGLPDRAQIWYESSSIIWPSLVKISSNSAKANTFYFGASDIRTPVRHLNTPLYCFHHGKSIMKVIQPLLCSLLTHSFLFVFTPHAHYPFGVFLVVVAGWHTGVASLQHCFGGCVAHWAEWFIAIILLEGCVAYQARRGADKHEKRAHGQRPGEKHPVPRQGLANMPRQRLANMPRQGIDQCSRAGNWQSVQGRNCKTCPGWALANVPRKGTGKRTRQGLQACPGRACTLASVPRQGTGKRPRQGLQTCPGRALANVPRQGSVDVPRKGTVVVPMQGTVGIAKV